MLSFKAKRRGFSGGTNALHKAPAPELVQLETDYAFSFNPSSQPVSLSNLAEWYTEHQRLLHEWTGANIHCVPELSSKGRLHFHGVIRILNVPHFYIHLKDYEPFGGWEIDTISDMKVWDTYCFKSKSFMKDFIEGYKLKYELNDINLAK